MRWPKTFSVALVICLVAGVASAQEATQKPKKPTTPQIPVLDAWLEGVELSAEQKGKVEALKRELGPAFAEVNKRAEAVYTEEQRKVRRDIAAKARAEGKQPQEIRKLQEEAVKLTPEQKEKLDQLMAERRELQRKLAKHLLEILTPEQRATVEPRLEKTLKAGQAKKPAKQPEPPKERKEAKKAQQQQS